MYDLVGVFGLFILVFFLILQKKKKDRITGALSLFLQSNIDNYLPKTWIVKLLSSVKFWTLFEFSIFLFINLWCFLFAGYDFANRFMYGRVTDFYGFIYETTFFLLIFCLIFRIDYLKILDLITPNFAFMSGFLKLACLFHGCCNTGTFWKYGYFNQNTQQLEFPIQLIECFASIAIFLFLIYYKRKCIYGTLFPLFLMLYSLFRYIIQFFKETNIVLYNFDLQQIVSITSFCISILIYILIKNHSSLICSAFTTFPINTRSKTY